MSENIATIFSDRIEGILEKAKKAFLEEMNIPENDQYDVKKIRWSLHAWSEPHSSFHIEIDFKVSEKGSDD